MTKIDSSRFRHLILLQIIGTLFPLAVLCHVPSSSHPNFPRIPGPQPPPPQRSNPNDNSTLPNVQLASTDVIQVQETEVWTGDRWIGADPRWTTADGLASVSPAEISPPPGGSFEGEWKIILGGEERDNFGWVYMYSTGQWPRRQRIWLRAFQLHTSSRIATALPSASNGPETPQKKSAKMVRLPSPAAVSVSPAFEVLRSIPSRTQQLPSALKDALQLVKDDWNFKGFGFSFYKSFLFRNSFGAAFRIPLTTNLNLWDRHPDWPSLSMSISCFYPPTLSISVSGTVNVEWVKWSIVQLAILARQLIAIFLLSSARSLVFMGSALAYPITGQIFQLPVSVTLLPPLDSTFRDRPVFSSTLQERIGISYSWRISSSRGYEFRRQLSHLYLPTLLSLLQHAESIQQTLQQNMRAYSSTSFITRYLVGFVPRLVRSDKLKRDTRSPSESSSSLPAKKAPAMSLVDSSRDSKWKEWLLRRKTGSLGVSTAYPTRDAPYFSCSALLSLSGFYFKPDSFGGNARTRKISSGSSMVDASTSSPLSPKDASDGPAVTSAALRKTATNGTISAPPTRAPQETQTSAASRTASA
jgi:hypothetical protein